jgi:hypothetical protein
MKCGVCGGGLRKGKGTRVFVAAGAPGLGGIRRVLACVKCASKCVHLSLDASPARCDCGRAAVWCSQCGTDEVVRARLGAVGGAVRRIAGLLRAFPKGNPLHAGLSVAFDVLTSGRWEETTDEEGEAADGEQEPD